MAKDSKKKPTAKKSGVLSYDPADAPDVQQWKDLDEDARMFVVTTWHNKNAAGGLRHPESRNIRMHALAHVVSENLLAADEDPARSAFNRFREQGLSRHEAVHAIGNAVVQCMLELANKGEEYSSDRFELELGRIDPALFFDTAPDRDD